MNAYLQEKEAVLEELASTEEGLTKAEAEKRLVQYGPNRLEEAKKDSFFKRLMKQLSDPMIIVLIAAAVVSGITSAYTNESFADVFIILFVVIINALLGMYQESKAEKAIEALKEISAATSKVLRDGEIVSIPSDSLVPGDVIALEAGDAVPADARIIECASLKVEESALTGESVPVKKIVDALTSENNKVPLGDRKKHGLHGKQRGLRTRTCRCYRHRHEDGDGQDRQRHQRDKEQRNAAADQIESAVKDSQHRRAGHLCIHLRLLPVPRT